MRLLFIIALIFFANLTVQAQAAEYNLKSISSENYAKLIDEACRKPSQPYWDHGGLSMSLEGTAKYKNCLYKHIQVMTKNYFYKTMSKEYSYHKSNFDTQKANLFVQKIAKNYKELKDGVLTKEKSCADGRCYGFDLDSEIELSESSIYLLVIKDLALGMIRGEKELPPPPAL
ncbi:MAG: hypothetical protein ACOYK8_00525 [Alphaproteobacteria bacterium]